MGGGGMWESSQAHGCSTCIHLTELHYGGSFQCRKGESKNNNNKKKTRKTSLWGVAAKFFTHSHFDSVSPSPFLLPFLLRSTWDIYIYI
jgi:hypothetical protein